MNSTDDEFHGSTTFITKGPRTKRQRTVTTTTTTATATTSYNENYIETSYGSSASATPSPSSTPDVNENENDVVSELTTEEEETANCLILLSNGGDNRRRRRNAAAASSGGVYECKTCNRTFPSFQALGGHRTSHKKIIKPPKFEEIVSHESMPVTPPRTAVVEVVTAVAAVAATVVKAHVCGICGSEFPSGQALGGHMRRHRPSIIPAVPSENHPIIIRPLPLDLNLPAPNDDHDDDDDQVIVVDSSHHMVDNTQFHVLPPTPALLDCHY